MGDTQHGTVQADKIKTRHIQASEGKIDVLTVDQINVPGGVGAVNAVTASFPLSSTGGMFPNIALTGSIPMAGDVGGTHTATVLATVNASPGMYTNSNVTVNGKGLVTSASSGPNPILAVSVNPPLVSSGGVTPTISLNPVPLAGDVTGSTSATVLPNTIAGATYPNPSSITVDNKGRATSISVGSAPVTSVSGTPGNITATVGTTPVINLATTAVTPGSYTTPNLDIDSFGRITFATPGVVPPAPTTLTGDITGTGTGTVPTTYNGIVPVNKGGTGTATHTTNNLLAGNGTSAIISTGVTYTANTLTYPAATTVATSSGAINHTSAVSFSGATVTANASTQLVVSGPAPSLTWAADIITLIPINATIVMTTSAFVRLTNINGTSSIQNITPPTFAGWAGIVCILNDSGTGLGFVTTGNIGRVFNLPVQRYIPMLYHPSTNKWFPTFGA